MKFGSFDSLIKLVDDMGKFDSQVESVIRRIERQVFDLDNKVELNVRTLSKIVLYHLDNRTTCTNSGGGLR